MKIFEYLSSLSQNELEDLYQDQWTCKAILRTLPPRAKQYILKMLMIDYPIPISSAKEWTSSTSMQTHKEALKKLFDLKIILLNRSYQQSVSDSIRLNPIYQENIKKSLADMNQTVFTAQKDTSKAPTIEVLDSFSKSQWEKVLYFLSDEQTKPSPLISDLLLTADLTKPDNGSLSITSEGFKFLLKDVYTQIWTLLIVYLNNNTPEKKKDLLTFLFKLSFLTLGKGYLVSNLNDLQKELLMDLKQFGLIYMVSNQSTAFYPTRLIISLTTGKTLSLFQNIAAEREIAQKEQGYIILETNYRLYAYTSSSLQISLLSLFVKMLYRLPNLAVGIITRESIRTALIHGITADQIIEFVRHNAHPNAVNNGQPIPDVVAEQIKLWEAERNRISYTKSVLYNSFPTTDCYNATVKFAQEQDFYIYSNDANKTLIVNENGNDPIRTFIRRNFG